MPLFFDLEALSERQTDGVLDYVYKAITHDHDDGGMDEHPSLFVRRLVELFSQRGLTRLKGVQAELKAWMDGERHREGALIPRVDVPGTMYRWTPSEAELVQLYLQALPPDQWTLDDYMLMVEHTVQRHMPADVLRTEAEWLATKASLMGRVQAALGDGVTAAQADKLLQELPSSVNAARNQFGMTAAQARSMEFAANRAAEYVTSLADTTRHDMRSLIARAVEARELGQSGPSLQTQLFDDFADLNRDWRRIAVTEATEALGQGYIAAQPFGTKVKRKEQYRNACAWCRKIDGAVLTVVDPGSQDKDWDTEVWVGKTNIGRSASPRRRQGGVLVERQDDEMWKIAAGAQHPHCRGTWLPYHEDVLPGEDDDFVKWARGVLRSKD